MKFEYVVLERISQNFHEEIKSGSRLEVGVPVNLKNGEGIKLRRKRYKNRKKLENT